MASVTIYGSTLESDTPQKYIAVASGGNNVDAIWWYINGYEIYENNNFVKGREVLITPKFNQVISAVYFVKGDPIVDNERVESNKIRIGKVETFSGVIEPPPPPPPPPPPLPPLPPIPEFSFPPEIIVPVPITFSINGPCGINGLPQTYTATASGGDNTTNIAWYRNDNPVMMPPGTSYTVTANMGDTISAIYYPFTGSGRDATGSNRIKIRRYNDMSCPPPDPPPPPPSLVLPPEPVAPPPAPVAPEPQPPPAPVAPPPAPVPEPLPPSILLPPRIDTTISEVKPDNLNVYLPYIIGGVLIYFLLF